jgi:hypothetical protein
MQVIEEEMIRLHNEDIILTKLWIDKLEKEKIRIFLKDKITQPPPGSNLDTETFVMCLQTPYQVDTFRCLGNCLIGINVTHNVTRYPSFLLFTIVARDWWGHGM